MDREGWRIGSPRRCHRAFSWQKLPAPQAAIGAAAAKLDR
jgi:hypothetical protein